VTTPGRELLLRGGWGLFYDMGQNGFGAIGFPYSFTNVLTNGVKVPFTDAVAVFPPPNFTPVPTNRASITVADDDYDLPKTLPKECPSRAVAWAGLKRISRGMSPRSGGLNQNASLLVPRAQDPANPLRPYIPTFPR
jgi:hypothetical protein